MGNDGYLHHDLWFVYPIVSKLLLPSEVVDAGDMLIIKLLNDVSRVHVGGHESDDDFPRNTHEIRTNQLNEFQQILHIESNQARRPLAWSPAASATMAFSVSRAQVI